MSSAVTLLLVAPELADVDEAIRTQVLAIAEDQTGSIFKGVTRDLAVAYLAAHMLTLASRNGSSGGSVSSVKEGDLAISYAPLAFTKIGGLETTQYGVELRRIRSQNILGPRTGVSTHD